MLLKVGKVQGELIRKSYSQSSTVGLNAIIGYITKWVFSAFTTRKKKTANTYKIMTHAERTLFLITVQPEFILPNFLNLLFDFRDLYLQRLQVFATNLGKHANKIILVDFNILHTWH